MQVLTLRSLLPQRDLGGWPALPCEQDAVERAAFCWGAKQGSSMDCLDELHRGLEQGPSGGHANPNPSALATPGRGFELEWGQMGV